MPLLDHFHPPLSKRILAWESFDSFWAVSIADSLNRMLPQRFIAEIHTHLGWQVEADVAEFERLPSPEDEPPNSPAGSVPGQTWAPPAAAMTWPAVFPDDLEVEVRDQLDDARLVAVVELISPRNKDRADSRRAFGAKCAAYLQRGIGVVMVDIVSSRQFNLHNELVQVLGLGEDAAMPSETSLYTVAYRPARVTERNEIHVWPTTLTIGSSLPIMPLALKGTRAVPLDLESSYMGARQRSRL